MTAFQVGECLSCEAISSVALAFPICHRTLSTSDDVEDRENEKGRLEDAYEKCDRDLDELIVQHYTELTTAIRTYQSITERITNSRNKIKQVKKGRAMEGWVWHCLAFS